MATYTTQTPARGMRESLADFVSIISPEDTPIYSAASKGKASANFEEWQTDSLTAANPNNALAEGADATYPTPTATLRLGNYCQTSGKNFKVSGRLDAVNKAGRSSEISYQLMKQGRELRTDIEASISQNNAAVSGATPKSASLETWAWAVNSLGATGTTTVVTNGAPTTAPVDGTARALSETLVKNVLSSGFSNGMRYKMAVMGPTQKQNFSALAGLASTRNNFSGARKSQGVILGAADVYVSDFGDIALVPSAFMRNRSVLFLDPEYLEVRTLKDRNFKEEKLAKTGDAEGWQIITDWTLVVKNPIAVGKLADLT